MKKSKTISAILENPHTVLVLRNFLMYQYKKSNNNTNYKIDIYCPADLNLELISNFQIKKYLFARKLKIIIKIFFNLLFKRSEILLLNDLGLLNKIMIILLPAKKLFIIDEGIASIYRSNFEINLMNFRKRTSYYSMWESVNNSQRGLFNQDFYKMTKEKNFYDTFFYIASIKDEIFITRDSEKRIIESLKDIAKENNQKLSIIIHRANSINDYKSDEIYNGVEILQFDKPFEQIYLSTVFKNCSFSTFYSSALNVVSNDCKKYIITSSYVDPETNLDKTFLEKLLTSRDHPI